MAYAALVSLAQTIDLILNYHQDLISPQLENEVISIYNFASDIMKAAFVEDFPEKATNLEGRIKEAAHAAEDVIDFLLSKKIHDSFPAQSEFELMDVDEGGWSSCAGNRESTRHQSWIEYRSVGYDIYYLFKVTDEIESIAESLMKNKNSITEKGAGDSTAAASSSSAVAPPHKDLMVGRGDDLMEIKSRLCGESRKLQVIPILGMGGIGKTTLVRNVYDDPLTVEYFQIRGWVTVSKDYNVEGIISGLLGSMKGLDKKDESMEVHHVYQHLKSRRYLVVLDDVWSAEAWDDLRKVFPDDGNGSRIMITTRLTDVATYPDPYSHVHEMSLMDEDQSWDLLRQKVFKQDPCPVELEDVGKMIARSCRGLPLAIAVISGLLIVGKSKATWENIAEDVKSAISAYDEEFDKILSLSYTRLPHHLRPCFLYMGGFPEDYKMSAADLIRLWVAEGFLIQNGSNKSFEETAEEYLEDLINRSLVSVTKRKTNGRIKIVRMHDLMREMCTRKAKEENFILYLSEPLGEGTETPRRINISHHDLTIIDNFSGSTIRTIIFEINPEFIDGRSCCLGQFRLLRVLDLSNYSPTWEAHYYWPKWDARSLPTEVYELLHLRYLALDILFVIGAAISNLQNLQTLIIVSPLPRYKEPIELPVEIWSLPQLRHLIVSYARLPLPQSFDTGAMLALENLQTFSIAVDFVCTPEILNMIPKLKKLGISYVRSEDVDVDVDYHLQNLIHLQQLETLRIEMHMFPCALKHNLAFPLTLKKLTLRGLGLAWAEMAIVSSLPSLEVLKLQCDACVGDTWETTEGEFLQLTFLQIHISSQLQYWITESSHFPRLKFLVLRYCNGLSEIPDGVAEIETLELIKVLGPKSLEDSAKQIREDQLNNSGYSALQVHVERHKILSDSDSD